MERSENTRRLSRRDVLRGAGTLLGVSAMPSLFSRAALAIELPSGESLEAYANAMFNACDNAPHEPVGFALHDPQSAPNGHTLDVRSAVLKKSATEIEFDSSSLMEILADHVIRLQPSAQARLLYGHGHPIESVRGHYPSDVVSLIESTAGAYAAMPSALDMGGTRQDLISTLLKLKLESLSATDTEIPIIRDCIFTNVGVFLQEIIEDSDPRYASFSDNPKRDDQEDDWERVSQQWLLHVNRALHSSRTWQEILSSPEYATLVTYSQTTFGISLAFIPRENFKWQSLVSTAL